MPKPILLAVSLALAAIFVDGGEACAKRIDLLVNATACEEYLERAEEVEYQTYHFIKGKFWGGSTRDRGLEEADFEDLAESLSDSLRKRGMYPEVNRAQGDLLIMISWGRTSLDPQYDELMGVAGMSESASGKNLDTATRGGTLAPEGGGESSIAAQTEPADPPPWGMEAASGGSQRARNRVLLGLEKPLAPPNPFGMSEDQALLEALEEERYFVILNAFDYQHLLANKELKQVWSVRYNTRAIGVGFENAYDSMTRAVSGVIGLNSGDVVLVKADTEGSVSMGELELVNLSEDEKRFLD